MSASAQLITAHLPIELYRRTRAVVKRYRSSTSQLVRESLTERLDAIEAKEREEEARKRAAKRAELEDRRAPGIDLAPRASSLAPGPLDDSARTPAVDPLDAIYLHHATHILEVLNDPDPSEKRLRVATGIAAVKLWIKDFTPLTDPPPDGEILRRLERVLIGVRTKAPSSTDVPLTSPLPRREPPPPYAPPGSAPSLGRVIDDLVGRAISPDRLQSYGDDGDTKR